MSVQESISKRLKKRQDELKVQKDNLEKLLSAQDKTEQSIKNTKDMINLITGAVFELTETEKEMNSEKAEVQA